MCFLSLVKGLNLNFIKQNLYLDHVVTAEDDMQYDEEMEEDANLRDETLEQQGTINTIRILTRIITSIKAKH